MRSLLLLLLGLSLFTLSTSVTRPQTIKSNLNMELRATAAKKDSFFPKRRLRSVDGRGCDTITRKDGSNDPVNQNGRMWQLFCSMILNLNAEQKSESKAKHVSSLKPANSLPKPAQVLESESTPLPPLVPESRPSRSLMPGMKLVVPIATELELKLPRTTNSINNPSKSHLVMRWLHKVAKFRSKHGVDTISHQTLYEWLSPSTSDAKLAMFFVGLRENEALKETAGKMLAYMIMEARDTKAVGRAWLRSEEDPVNLFTSMNLKEANFKDVVFSGWLKYANLYDKKWNLQNKRARVDRQLFYYKVYDFLYSITPDRVLLEHEFRNLALKPGMRSFGSNLADIARRERQNALYLTENSTPKDLLMFLNVQMDVSDTNLLQWLRFCQSYKVKETIDDTTYEKMLLSFFKRKGESKAEQKVPDWFYPVLEGLHVI